VSRIARDMLRQIFIEDEASTIRDFPSSSSLTSPPEL
jgi:hypothetical protein